MKLFAQVIAFALCMTLLVGVVQATPMLVFDHFPSASGLGFNLFLDTGDADGEFNTIIVEVLPEAGDTLQNYNPSGTSGFTPLGPGADASYTNAFLGAPVAFGGLGFSVIDGGTDNVSSSGPDGIGYNAGPLGANISSQDPIHLNTVILPNHTGRATANVRLINTGNVIAELSVRLVPEPTTLALGGLAMIGVVCSRRRFS